MGSIPYYTIFPPYFPKNLSSFDAGGGHGVRFPVCMVQCVYMEEIFLTLSAFIVPGATGGAVRGLVGISKNVLKDGKPFNVFRFIFSLIVAIVAGAFAATVTGGDWRIALLAGYAGSDLLESLYKIRLLGIFKAF